jgi:hypothetical protein
MYELIRHLPASRLLLEQLPQLAVALTIAELFYKFHSFLLETGAFLVTWFALGAAHAALLRLLTPRGEDRP